jgi:hypothetical protein
LFGEPLSVTDRAPSVPEQLAVALPFPVVVVGSLPDATSDVYSVLAVDRALAPVLPLIV